VRNRRAKVLLYTRCLTVVGASCLDSFVVWLWLTLPPLGSHGLDRSILLFAVLRRISSMPLIALVSIAKFARKSAALFFLLLT
jgi:hypothetical protein